MFASVNIPPPTAINFAKSSAASFLTIGFFNIDIGKYILDHQSLGAHIV